MEMMSEWNCRQARSQAGSRSALQPCLSFEGLEVHPTRPRRGAAPYEIFSAIDDCPAILARSAGSAGTASSRETSNVGDLRDAQGRGKSDERKRPNDDSKLCEVRTAFEPVFEHLTQTKPLPGWFGEGVIEHHSGGEVRLMDAHIRGVVTQWHPTRRLAHTWNVFNPGEDISRHPES
jgi:hypothetical protein